MHQSSLEMAMVEIKPRFHEVGMQFLAMPTSHTSPYFLPSISMNSIN